MTQHPGHRAPPASWLLAAAVSIVACAPVPLCAQRAGGGSLSQLQVGVALDTATRQLFADAGRGLTRRFETVLAAERMGTIVDGLPTQFRLNVAVTPSGEDAVPGTPVMLLVRGTVTAVIEDSATRTRVASWATDVQGTGQTVQQAWASLASSVRLRDDFSRMLRTANERMVSMYEAQCSRILADADALNAARDFDAAIYRLETVPTAAATCRTRAQNAVIATVAARETYLCGTTLARARTRWAASKSRETAALVATELEVIDGSATCFADVDELLSDIARRTGEYDASAQRAIEEQVAFERQQYSDRLALIREMNQSRERVALAQAASGSDASRLALDVAREISLAFARSLSNGVRGSAIRVHVDPQ